MAFNEGLPEADDLKIRYMASPHIEWTKFCESEKLNPHSRAKYPVALWQDEKKKVIAQRECEEISTMLFDRRFKWNRDVLRTLNEYPASIDVMHAILNTRLRTYAKMVNDKDPKFEEISNTELRSLASGLKAVTEAKYKALMIDDITIKRVEDDSKPDEKDVSEAGGLKFEVMGMGQLSTQAIQKMMDDYLDKPNEAIPET